MKTIEKYLTTYKDMYENYNDKTSKAAIELAENIKAMERTLKILEQEAEYQADQEAHSEVTLELEEIDL